jgi:hypothetical protein
MKTPAPRLASLQLSFFALCAAILLTLCSCSPGGDPAIIGKWQDKDTKEIVEFRSSGKLVWGKKDDEITDANWEWENTNHIRLTMTHKLVGKASGTMKVTLNGDTLILKDEDSTTEYARVK